MPAPDVSLIRQLAANSASYRDPLAAIDWSRLDTDSYWLPQSALSLYGLAEYATLSEAVKKRLSQCEFVNIVHSGLWLEGIFLRRISRRLELGLPAAEYAFFLHEIREEAGHSLMFMRAIEESGLSLPLDAWRKPRFADFLARHAPAGGVLFWLATVIAEDLPDKFNRYVRSHAGGDMNPVIRQICTLHIVDEARHIAFARRQLEAALAGSARRVAWLAPLVRLLLKQFVATFYAPGAAFYEMAGLTHGGWWRKSAQRNPARIRFIRECVGPTVRLLEGYGIRVRLD
jgi:hypothetical protein